MDVRKPIFCGLAFGSASINSYGEYIPCCNIRTDHWEMYKDAINDYGIFKAEPKRRINAPNLRELRREMIKGNWPLACMNCKEAEDAGVSSMRTIWNKGLEENNIPLVEYVDPNNIYYLDLTSSTKCNSKCMTCNPDLSDFWQEEHEKIWSIAPYQQKTYKRVCIDDETATKIAKDFPNVENIAFIGGEPTISEEHLKFLHLLVQEGRSKRIRLSYVTNLTGYNDELSDLWKQFKSVHISVSIDGYEKVNEYIRYPIKWNKCETNVRRFLSMVQDSFNDTSTTRTYFTIGLSCTVSIFNAIQCADLFEYWFDTLIEYKTIDSTLAHHVGCFVNRVTFPPYAMVSLLTKEYRDKGIDRCQQLLDKIDLYLKNNPTQIVNAGMIDSIRLTMSWLEEEQLIDSKLLSDNKHLITESDLYRNRRLQDYIPELWEELEKIWKQ